MLAALGGEKVPESTLTDALWPSADGDAAHRSFSTTLYRLRHLIGQNTLRFSDGRLTLDSTECWLDTRQLTTALRRKERALADGDSEALWSAISGAMSLYQAPFLDGEFDPPEILSARKKLHSLYLRHVLESGAWFFAREHGERAAEIYQRALEADELSETLYQRLMRCYLQQGRIAEGLALYDRCRAVVMARAGVNPSSETETAHKEFVAVQRAPSLLRGTPGESSPTAPAVEQLGIDTPKERAPAQEAVAPRHVGMVAPAVRNSPRRTIAVWAL